MKIAVITANLGNFETPVEYVEQSMPYTFFNFTDNNFPPRTCSMTPRLQARIVKMFGWQMVPNYDYYIWVDSSSALLHKDCVKWYIYNCADIAVFLHPQRNTIRQEADYIQHRLSRRCEYLTPRYKNELITEQMEVIEGDKEYIDDCLFCSTAFVYKNTKAVQDLLKEWWYHTSRFHSVDQLSLPYVIKKSGCKYNILPAKRGHSRITSPYLTLVRK